MKRDCNPSGPRKGRPFPSRLRPAVLALLALGGTSAAGLAVAQTSDADSAEKAFTLGGYVRAWASMNLQDQPETTGDDKHKLSMLRGSILLDADYKPTNSLRFKAIARVDREARTSYLKSLEAAPSEKPPGSTAAVFNTFAGGNVGGLKDVYNNGEFREWWVESDVTDRVKFKFGRQQVVWGETDFFRSLDVVHGFDYSWRSFLEVENEELRKPLVMLRTQIQVPEAKGSLDVFVRPGWDRDGDIGNTYDLAGGRWASQPTRGASFLFNTAYNYHSKGADQDDVTGGIRWQGIAGPVNYSVAWVNTFNNDPVANPCASALALLGTTGAQSFKQEPVACTLADSMGAPTGPFAKNSGVFFGDWIFPKTNIFGATASGYVPAVDAVFTMELGYQRDRSFNYGFVNQGPVGTNLPGRTNFVAPGALGVIQKNTLTTMIRMDKQLDLSDLIGTSRPSFSSIQLFNTRILDFNAAEEIVQLAYWGRARSKDSALLTGFIVMNYDNDRINPGLAAGWDVSYGGGFIIPSIEFVLGDKWRVKAEADLFYNSGNEKQRYLNPTTFAYEEQGKGAGLMGYFSKSNQALIRVTRQF
jgi:hypothetical protein